jgi:hypothetical protein
MSWLDRHRGKVQPGRLGRDRRALGLIHRPQALKYLI